MAYFRGSKSQEGTKLVRLPDLEDPGVANFNFHLSFVATPFNTTYVN
jgi:hypothetical protein